MRLAVVLPTRGLVFTEVLEQLEEMRHQTIRQKEPIDMHIFYSKDLGIPDAQNILVDQALAIDPEYILFIEEDTVPTSNALRHMVNANADIAFIDYGVTGWSCSARSTTGEILWCGLGCTLVSRRVFAGLEKPYFRTDKTLHLNDWTWGDQPAKYGGQDIWFCCMARKAGFTLTQVTGECKHMQITALAEKGVNNGRHVLEQKPIITKTQVLTLPDAIDNNDSIGTNPQP